MAKKLDLNKPKPKAKRKPRKKKEVTVKGESLGVGDAIEKITKATGIKKAVEVFSLITGADCGCEERKAKLNDMFRRQRLKARCITQDEYQHITNLLEIKGNKIHRDTALKIAKIYSDVFKTRYEFWCIECPGIWKDKMKDLQKVIDLYKEDLNQEA